MSKLEVQEKAGKIFCPLKNDWFVAKPEEKVRQKYITILVNEHGYSLDQMAQEQQVNNSSHGQGKARADIVIWKSKKDKDDGKSAFIVVECKAENVKVHVEDYYQGFNYASWAHAEFFVTTNEKETKYFNVDPTCAVFRQNINNKTYPDHGNGQKYYLAKCRELLQLQKNLHDRNAYPPLVYRNMYYSQQQLTA